MVGLPVHGPHGEQLGVVTRVYRDDVTGYPEWITVRLRGREHVVPVGPTQLHGDRVAIAFDADAVSAAPDVGAGEHLSVDDHRRLVEHYGLDRTSEAEPAAFDRTGEPGAGPLRARA